MHYYQHHIGDYRKDTGHLSLLEHGIYRQLLDLYYISEKPLDANALRLICARTPDEQDAAKLILKEFFTLEDGVYFHNRCEDEITKFHSKSASAKASAKARWNKNKDLQDANALRTDCDGNANHKPLPINHKPLTNKKTILSNELENYFEDFWYKYPKKVGKEAARKAWNKAKPDIIQVIDAINWQRETKQWQSEDGKYIPNPATYLNQGRWLDEQPVVDMNPF